MTQKPVETVSATHPAAEGVTSKPAAAKKPVRTRRTKGEGQWALGYREPLNANEQFKKDDDALNVRARVEGIYAHRGFDSIDPSDLRGRLRWWGLYTQRKPGIDGGKTATLDPHELDDRFFMLRIRIDGGALTTDQLRVIGQISVDFARGTADVTDRQNVQLHWIRIEDMPEIWRRLEAVGLSTAEACGDCPRVILGSPVAGIAADEIIDPTPAIAEIAARYIGNPLFSNLPRKFKTAITGHPLHDVVPEVNDVAFVGVDHPEHGPGFDLWVGGGLSTNPMLAQRLGAWVPLEQVADVWAGVCGVFRDYGYRRLRTRARIKFLVADWGPEKFRQVLQDEYLARPLLDGPAPAVPARLGDHVGVSEQKDGNFFVGFAAVAGRVSGETLVSFADTAEAHGSTRIRTTPMQKLLVLDVAPDQVDSLVAAGETLGLSANPNAWRRSVMACTGIEFCKLAIVETKARAAQVVDELEARLGALDSPVTVHLNGCPNSCARIQVADIGLKGQLVPGPDGDLVEGFQAAGSVSTPASVASCEVTRSPPTSSERTSRSSPGPMSPAATPTSGSLSGSRVPTRASWYDRSARRLRARDQPGAAGGHVLPVLRRGDSVSHRGRRLGMPELPASVLGEVPRSAEPGAQRGCIMSTTLDLSEVAAHANRELEDATAAEIFRWAHDEFGTGLVVTSSLADTVMIHLAEQAAPGIDVIFLDTGYHFVETIGTRDAVAAVHAVNLITVLPEQTVAEQDATWGKDLFARNPDQCCGLRKVAPLNRALAPYSAWATGVRRADSALRSLTPIVAWDARRQLVKIAPIARWSDTDVTDYIEKHSLMVNPLLEDGYPSIGCEPCTQPADASNPRAGRWAGRGKTECGIQL